VSQHRRSQRHIAARVGRWDSFSPSRTSGQRLAVRPSLSIQHLLRTIAVDLGYDTEQVILRSSAEKFLTERYDYAVFRRSSESDAGFDRELWSEFARLGWIGLPFAPDDGGSGGGAVELAILMEASSPISRPWC
jgi:alkylation response protein AidB-like acyl-CoA dehydrogenase